MGSPDKHNESGIKVGTLADFDPAYWEDLNQRDKSIGGWLASEHCKNVHYFTVLSDTGEKLGIVGVYDVGDEKNITHTIVDPKYRGHGLATAFKDALMEKLDLPFVTLTINYDPYAPNDPRRTNVSSMRAAEKLPGVERVEDPAYAEQRKAKFIYRRRREVAEVLNGNG